MKVLNMKLLAGGAPDTAHEDKFSLQTLIKQLLVMKSAEENTFRRDLIDSIIRDFSNSDTGGPNRRTAIADNKNMFTGKKINRIH